MSKRSERREAERVTRKLAFQELRQRRAHTPIETEEIPTEASGPVTSDQRRTTSDSPSEAQLAANRANAQLSTGPVTPEGKAHSSRNALKTGLTGKTVLLPHEDADAYQRELNAFIETYQPATDEELRLVQSQLDCVWRIDRIQRLETAILFKGQLEFAGKFDDQPALHRARLIEAEAYLKYERQLRNLHIQEARLHRTMEKDRFELKRLQATRRRDDLAEVKAQVKTESTKAARKNGFEFSNQQKRLEASAKPSHSQQKKPRKSPKKEKRNPNRPRQKLTSRH